MKREDIETAVEAAAESPEARCVRLEEEIKELKEHKSNLKKKCKNSEQLIKSMTIQEAKGLEENIALLDEASALRQKNEDLKMLNRIVWDMREEMAAEINRVLLICIATQARHDRTIAALSKLFLDQQDKHQDALTEMEEQVIGHCLR